MIQVRIVKNRLLLPVRVTPRGGRDCILPASEGDTALKLKVSVPPEDGKANQAVVELIAGTLAVPKSRIKVVRGESARDKQLAVDIQTKEEADQLLDKLSAAIGHQLEAILA